MLLRTSSAPLLNSWLPQCSTESSTEPEFQLHPRTRSVSLSKSIDVHARKLTRQTVSELNMHEETSKPKKSKKTLINKWLRKDDRPRNPDAKTSSAPAPSSRSALGRLLSSSGLGEEAVNGDEKGDLQNLRVGGGMESSDVGKIYSYCESDGCGGSGGGASVAGFFESNCDGSDSIDAYYRNMINANPENGLLLGNYAEFLKEVRGNLEEYCERTICANMNDGHVLSLYADIIWQRHKDSQGAENYFKQAIEVAPEDCYVVAAYARFLWDVEEVEDEGEERRPNKIGHGHLPPNIFLGAPITAAS